MNTIRLCRIIRTTKFLVMIKSGIFAFYLFVLCFNAEAQNKVLEQSTSTCISSNDFLVLVDSVYFALLWDTCFSSDLAIKAVRCYNTQIDGITFKNVDDSIFIEEFQVMFYEYFYERFRIKLHGERFAGREYWHSTTYNIICGGYDVPMASRYKICD